MYWQSVAACAAQAARTTSALTCNMCALQDDHTAADYYFDSYAHFGTRSYLSNAWRINPAASHYCL